MKLLVNGKYYDSSKVPVLIIFEGEEQETFNGLERYVAVPDKWSKWQTEILLNQKLEITQESKWQKIKRLIREEIKHQ